MIPHGQPHSGDCAFRSARSVAPFNLPELANVPAQADSRRYRKRSASFGDYYPKDNPVILAETVFTAWMIINAWLPDDPYKNCGLPVERNVCCFVLFRRTRGVDRDLSGLGARLDQIVLHQVLFHFFATDVGEHHAINLNAWRKRLTTLLFHLPTERRVLDDVLLLIRKVVLA
jgi:hypothetical protein